MIMETERLIIRRFKKNDLKAFYEYAQNPNVGPNAGWKPHENIKESKKILSVLRKEKLTWAIILKDSEKFVGSVGLYNDKKRNCDDIKMLGYSIGEEYWGKGFAVEASRAVLNYAFTELNLNYVSAYHFPENVRSKRVIEKCGFIFEGVLSHAYSNYDGTILDNACYIMSKENFLKL
ncbi:MAG: GNAT family N-acetyltransferase [Oscillospiraceae bacterium]|nr:GNAT family N-acetyltransferase [Oscillospiraceae bacterium]